HIPTRRFRVAGTAVERTGRQYTFRLLFGQCRCATKTAVALVRAGHDAYLGFTGRARECTPRQGSRMAERAVEVARLRHRDSRDRIPVILRHRPAPLQFSMREREEEP